MSSSKAYIAVILLGLFFAKALHAQTITLDERDATVWAQEQVVAGEVSGTLTDPVFHVNEQSHPLDFGGSDSTFSVSVRLQEGANALAACGEAEEGATICSDTLRYQLGYELDPEVQVTATVSERTVQLSGTVLSNPDSAALSYAWLQDADNPKQFSLSVASDTAATVTIPESAPHGEYYYGWQVVAADGDTTTARTFATVDSTGVNAYDIASDHARWVDEAIIYEIPPHLFTYQRKLQHITDKLPELDQLGVNTIWLQPIYPYGPSPEPTQAYGVSDYFEISSILGSEKHLHRLIREAHDRDMKVMLDFVAKHTSIKHDYARDAIESGAQSHYYDFYMREPDENPPFSISPNVRHKGEMTFVYDFYEPLVNLNYDNPEVERFIIEATRYWVEEFDIDGYRFDAVWGVVARDPGFVKRWRRALKRVKPSVFLLGESKAPNAANFDGRFDAAYDWTSDRNYISKWAFQRTGDRGETIFNSGLEQYRSRNLRNALTNDGEGFHPDAKILRFLENNDTPRFRDNHGIQQTKMAATLMFALPGIPMLYYGQEIGATNRFPRFSPSQSIQSYKQYYTGNFRPYYQHLIRLRKEFPALYGDHFAEIGVQPEEQSSHVFAFRRWTSSQEVLGVINMGADSATVQLGISVEQLNVQSSDGTYYLTDLVTGEARPVSAGELESLTVGLDKSTTRLFTLADSAVALPTGTESPVQSAATTFRLMPNYPNPFHRSTTIPFRVPPGGKNVRLEIYDLLGRKVQTMVDRALAGGEHTVRFAGSGLPSGVYIYRLTYDGHTESKHMTIVR